MRVFLVYDRRTGEPVSTVEEGKPAGMTTGQFLAALPPAKRKQMAVIEVASRKKAPKRRGRSPSRDS
jgi:hypothetical protein